MNRINIKVNSIELRSCNESLLQNGEHTTMEIIKWERSNVYVLAHWKGRELKFVGNRPFGVDKDIFWQLAELGQEIIEKEKGYDYD